MGTKTPHKHGHRQKKKTAIIKAFYKRRNNRRCSLLEAAALLWGRSLNPSPTRIEEREGRGLQRRREGTLAQKKTSSLTMMMRTKKERRKIWRRSNATSNSKYPWKTTLEPLGCETRSKR